MTAELSVLLLLATVVATASFQNHASVTKQLEPKKELFPYQQHGVERMVSKKRLLNADEMGLGKTVQCIEALNRVGTEDSIILIICPKSVLGVWQQELEQWLKPELASIWTVHIASTKSKPSPQPGTITLINYDICFKLEKELQEPDYQVLICDECHALKSMDSKRTKSILGRITGRWPKPGIRSEYLWLLTGTPVLNRPVELFPIVHSIDPDEFPSFNDYANRYCDPKSRTLLVRGRPVTVQDYSGATNLGELSKRLDPLMVRRCKAEVLSQLPPKFRSCLLLTTNKDIAQEERELLREALQEGGFNEEDMMNSIGLDDFGSSSQRLLAYIETGKSTKELLGMISNVRQETAWRKLEPAIELLEEYISQEKVVVFVHHRAIFDSLMEHFGSQAVGIKGGMAREDRDEAVQQFQNDPEIRLFVGSIRASALGLTLTAASHVVFLELDWSPGIMAQAEDRCHRVGQLDSVRVQYFVFKDTIDEWLSRSLIFKQNSIDQILPDKAPDEQSRDETGYVLNFGKHEGTPLADAPQSYVQFLVRRQVWRGRPDLWRAFASMGLVTEVPPPALDDKALPPERSDDMDASQSSQQQRRSKGTTMETDRPPPKVMVSRNNNNGDNLFDNADYTFTFGKHKGMKWADVPSDYRQWILDNDVWKRKGLSKALLAAGFRPPYKNHTMGDPDLQP